MDAISFGSRAVLPQDRESITTSFVLPGLVVDVVCGLYDDGTLGEIFIYTRRGDTEGDKFGENYFSSLAGMLDAWAVTFSIALQYGAPLSVLQEKIMLLSFPPNKFVREFGRSGSILDSIAKWLDQVFDLTTGKLKYGE